MARLTNRHRFELESKVSWPWLADKEIISSKFRNQGSWRAHKLWKDGVNAVRSQEWFLANKGLRFCPLPFNLQQGPTANFSFQFMNSCGEWSIELAGDLLLVSELIKLSTLTALLLSFLSKELRELRLRSLGLTKKQSCTCCFLRSVPM